MRDIKDYHTSQVTYIDIISSSEENDIAGNNSNNLDYVRTDLDAHANMVVLGENFHVTNYAGRTAEVQPFPQDISRYNKCQ